MVAHLGRDWNLPDAALRVIDVNGQLVSYDNRRLDAAREVGEPVPVEIVDPEGPFPNSTTGKTWQPPWDEYRQLAIKCVWALAAIGTSDALRVLRDAARSEAASVREAAESVLRGA
jgi:hypothetical protein